jgi:hypothetical protein
MSSVAAKNALDEIIVQYRKSLTNLSPNTKPELEIRLNNVDRNDFNTIYNYLLENTESDNIKLTQIVSSLMQVNSQQRTTNIREQHFNKGQCTKQQYLSKAQLITPYIDHNLKFKVALSLEKYDIMTIIIDTSALIRVKNRMSFTISTGNAGNASNAGNELKWRVDMSIIRQMQGSEAINNNMLKNVVDQMFRKHEVTPQNFLTIFNESKIRQNIYTYEIEIELIDDEHVKSNDIIEVAKKIIFIANPHYIKDVTMQTKLQEIYNIIHSSDKKAPFSKLLSIRQVLPRVSSLTRYDYRNIYPLDGYFITDKADGVHAVGYCDKDSACIITDTLVSYEHTANVKTNIVDAELVGDVLYVFDVIMYNGINVSGQGFDQRYVMLDKAVDELKKVGIRAVAKPYVQVLNEQLEKYIRKIYDRKRPYDIDGLIFVKPGDTYIQTKNYKWKKTEDNTIDFLVKKAPKSILGKEPFTTRDKYTLYLLFVGISYDMFRSLNLYTCHGYDIIFEDLKSNKSNYFPIQFSPSNAPLAYIYYHPDSSILNIEDNVVEFRCIKNCTATEGPLIEWQPVRIRTDRKKDLETKRYYGNDYKIAELTWINYLDPFPLEQLWINSTDEYFASNKTGMYWAQTSVMSYMKAERIMSYSHANWVLDVGSGKGQDLGRYFNARIKNLIAIDNDKASLSELIRRKFTFIDGIKKDIATNVYVILMNMTNDYTINLSKVYDMISIPSNHIDYIICNLSIHYYIYTYELLHNFINFSNNLLKINGHLVVSCFFGEAVFDLLKDLKEGDTWSVHEHEVLKYSIRKMYSSDKIENMGQKIGVLMSFSKGAYYEEFMVNTTYLTNELTKQGYKLLVKRSVKDLIPNFNLKNPSVGSTLTNDDITYLSLYGELVYQKVK